MRSDEEDWNQVKRELESAVKLARRGATVSGVLEQAEDALLATQKAVRQSAEATAAAAAVAKGELEQAVRAAKADAAKALEERNAASALAEQAQATAASTAASAEAVRAELEAAVKVAKAEAATALAERDAAFARALQAESAEAKASTAQAATEEELEAARAELEQGRREAAEYVGELDDALEGAQDSKRRMEEALREQAKENERLIRERDAALVVAELAKDTVSAAAQKAQDSAAELDGRVDRANSEAAAALAERDAAMARAAKAEAEAEAAASAAKVEMQAVQSAEAAAEAALAQRDAADERAMRAEAAAATAMGEAAEAQRELGEFARARATADREALASDAILIDQRDAAVSRALAAERALAEATRRVGNRERVKRLLTTLSSSVKKLRDKI